MNGTAIWPPRLACSRYRLACPRMRALILTPTARPFASSFLAALPPILAHSQVQLVSHLVYICDLYKAFNIEDMILVRCVIMRCRIAKCFFSLLWREPVLKLRNRNQTAGGYKS
ncbi:conserved hypothetical protein [Coccidioides posadasii str. Silveira]|uniref:Uncharacterized protein n=1 Tax=Coccidioides posadasii (strain RMSCC 757 / Silveira) TaxID=443226 RepID=E9D0I4_COCPS|nr:conserved hypothetical protein [Coccidioides posadasii str. Silveira]